MKRIILITTILMMTISLVYAQESLLFVCEEYPPYEYSSDGALKGVDVEIIRAVCKDANIKYEIKFFPWERCVMMAKSGQADVIFGILKNSERLKYFKYPSTPISFDKRIILSKSSYNVTISKLSDLNGKMVGVVRGYAYSEEFDNSKIFVRDVAVDGKSAILKLDNNRYDLTAVNEYFAKYHLGSKWSNYKVHPYVITSSPLFTAFSLKSKKALSHFDSFNHSFFKLEKNGTLNTIRNKYK